MSQSRIKKSEDQRLVWGEVYAPNRPDVDGEFMTADDIREMAYDFMVKQLTKKVDVQHNNKTIPGVTIVESFIARDGDPDFIPGAWVVGAHINDAATWDKVKKGELNGFSVEALVIKQDQEVEIDIPDVVRGTTSEVNGHVHKFAVPILGDGQLAEGRTDIVNGHMHRIVAGTITEESQAHRHRFSSVDNMRILDTTN